MARTVSTTGERAAAENSEGLSRGSKRRPPIHLSTAGPFGAEEIPTGLSTDYDPHESDQDFSFLNNKIGEERIHEAKAHVRSLKGRSGVYEPTVHPRMAFLILSKGGMTLEELAEIFDIKYGTLLSWLHRYKEFATALQLGRDVWYAEDVEKTLFKKALGYEYEEKEFARVPILRYEYDDKGKPHAVIVGHEEKLVKRTLKQASPDTASLLFVLQNRMPDRWRNTRFVHIDSKASVNHAHLHMSVDAKPTQEKVTDLSTEQLLQLETMAHQMGILKEGSLSSSVSPDYEMDDDEFSVDKTL